MLDASTEPQIGECRLRLHEGSLHLLRADDQIWVADSFLHEVAAGALSLTRLHGAVVGDGILSFDSCVGRVSYGLGRQDAVLARRVGTRSGPLLRLCPHLP